MAGTAMALGKLSVLPPPTREKEEGKGGERRTRKSMS
jgi:hypothetical protein